MTEMIERVAKALFLKNNPRLSWEKASRESTDHFRSVAKIAIEAMREPTEAMLVSGDEQIIEFLKDHIFALRDSTPAAAAWQLMIDKALKDEQ